MTKQLTPDQLAAERARFEAAISSSPYERNVSRFPEDPDRFAWPGNYRDITVDLAWNMWLEALGARDS